MNEQYRLKVSGVNDAETVRAWQQKGVDMFGLAFTKGSPDYVGMIPSRAGIIPDYSSLVNRESPFTGLTLVGIFRDDMPQNIVTRVYNYPLDYIQLDGDESVIMIDNLRRTLVPDICPKIRIIKTLSVSCPDDVLRYKDYEGHVELFQFNIAGCVAGHDGELPDWSLFDAYTGAEPFLVGSVTIDAVCRMTSPFHPRLIGFEVNK